jgi:DnaJ like chaperone protein
MTRTDIIVVIVCLFAGYFLMSWLIGRFKGGTKPGSESPGGRTPPESGHWQERPRQAPPPRPDDAKRPWYEVLQVPAYASLDDVKQAYRRRIAEYHPDKTGGLGDDLRALAEQKSKEINVAYETALKAFDK